MTTPGDPRSIRKLDNASKVDGSVRTESCNHEEGTIFYATIGWDQSTQPHGIQSPPSLVKIRSLHVWTWFNKERSSYETRLD